MTPPMTRHSEPAREAVARALHEHFGTSSTTMFTAREAGRQAASVALRHLSASPAPAAGGLEAVLLDDLTKRTKRAGPGMHIALSYREMKLILAALASPAATSAETQGGDGVRELLAGLSDFDHMMACHVGIGYFDGTEITKEWDRLVRPAMDRLKSQLAKLSAPLDALEEARASERQTFRDAAAISVWNDALKDALHDLLSRPTDGAARIRARETLTAALVAAEVERDRAREALAECEEYFDNRADADCDQDGFVPNKEMNLLSVVRAALSTAKGLGG